MLFLPVMLIDIRMPDILRLLFMETDPVPDLRCPEHIWDAGTVKVEEAAYDLVQVFHACFAADQEASPDEGLR